MLDLLLLALGRGDQPQTLAGGRFALGTELVALVLFDLPTLSFFDAGDDLIAKLCADFTVQVRRALDVGQGVFQLGDGLLRIDVEHLAAMHELAFDFRLDDLRGQALLIFHFLQKRPFVVKEVLQCRSARIIGHSGESSSRGGGNEKRHPGAACAQQESIEHNRLLFSESGGMVQKSFVPKAQPSKGARKTKRPCLPTCIAWN